MRRFTLAVVLVLVAAGLVLSAAPEAEALDGAVTAAPGAAFANYSPPVVVADESVLFVNADPLSLLAAYGPHTFTHTVINPLDRLFDTGYVGFGASASVDVSGLAPGTYPFFCQVHQFFMNGTLVVP